MQESIDKEERVAVEIHGEISEEFIKDLKRWNLTA